mmetsp:Transcript_70243/g.178148  ORF Transcript_70243/g.178148 Transcript_70243/m.178148 type:complete len:316 (-) Transcript_70243:59-1006(-)
MVDDTEENASHKLRRLQPEIVKVPLLMHTYCCRGAKLSTVSPKPMPCKHVVAWLPCTKTCWKYSRATFVSAGFPSESQTICPDKLGRASKHRAAASSAGLKKVPPTPRKTAFCTASTASFEEAARQSTLVSSAKAAAEKTSSGCRRACCSMKVAAQVVAASRRDIAPTSTSQVRMLPEASKTNTMWPASWRCRCLGGVCRRPCSRCTGSGASASAPSPSSSSPPSSSAPAWGPSAMLKRCGAARSWVRLAATSEDGRALWSSMMIWWQSSCNRSAPLVRCLCRQARHCHEPRKSEPLGSWCWQLEHFRSAQHFSQ